jgi:Ca-activated chloride channel homolog
MIQGLRYAAKISLLGQICISAFAFQQATDGPIQIIPREPLHQAPAGDKQPVLRVDSSLVLIPVHVTNAGGGAVTGLKKEDFQLFADGVPQRITHFVQVDAPISAGVLLDISGSMKNKLRKASEAAREFFKFANPEDEFFLVEFNGRAHLQTPFTRDWSGIADEIARAKASGTTALLDGIHLGIAQMKRARNARKALIVLSDGGDNFSRRSLRELKATLMESDTQVYALGVFDRDYSRKHTPEERNGPKLLDQVAVETGGRDYPVLSLDDLPGIGVEIARALRNQYVLGFSPASLAADGKFHRVNLKLSTALAESELRTYYRQGYYAPGP